MIRDPLRRWIAPAACALLAFGARATVAEPSRFVKGELLAVPAARAAIDRGAVRLDARAAAPLAAAGIDRVATVGRGAKSAGLVVKLASDRPDFDPNAAAEALRASGLFRAVMPNYRMRLFTTVPNDPALPLQWSVESGDAADIDLEHAWDVAQGDTGVVIAILDTGVDTTHPDLASQIAIHRGEIPANGLDDDGNGYVDDVKGWDFGDGDSDANPGPFIDPIGLDVGFHGTFCAALASAATNNAQGIAGAGWKCRILPLKVGNAASEITSDAIAEAVLYGVDNGASILSMSFGGPGDPGVPEFFQALVDFADSANVLCVAAAGNDGTDTPSYPAACDRVLAVAATDDLNARADFSNYGAWVDVAAPGAAMWSAIAQNYVVDDISQIFYLLFFGWDGETPYMYGDGTSFACPLTAGVCGLVRARWPSMSAAQVLAHVVETGDAVAFDQPVGTKLNAFRAVSAPPVAVETAPGPAFGGRSAAPNPSRGPVSFALDLPHEGVVRASIVDLAGRVVFDSRAPLARGAGAWTWSGFDARGRAAAPGVYFARFEFDGRALTRRLVRLAP